METESGQEKKGSTVKPVYNGHFGKQQGDRYIQGDR